MGVDGIQLSSSRNGAQGRDHGRRDRPHLVFLHGCLPPHCTTALAPSILLCGGDVSSRAARERNPRTASTTTSLWLALKWPRKCGSRNPDIGLRTCWIEWNGQISHLEFMVWLLFVWGCMALRKDKYHGGRCAVTQHTRTLSAWHHGVGFGPSLDQRGAYPIDDFSVHMSPKIVGKMGMGLD